MRVALFRRVEVCDLSEEARSGRTNLCFLRISGELLDMELELSAVVPLICRENKQTNCNILSASVFVLFCLVLEISAFKIVINSLMLN